jgi:hypothetical protein
LCKILPNALKEDDYAAAQKSIGGKGVVGRTHHRNALKQLSSSKLVEDQTVRVRVMDSIGDYSGQVVEVHPVLIWLDLIVERAAAAALQAT